MSSKNTITQAIYTKVVSIDDALELVVNAPKEKHVFLCEECGCKLSPRDEHMANDEHISPARFEHYKFEEGQKRCSKRYKDTPGYLAPNQ